MASAAVEDEPQVGADGQAKTTVTGMERGSAPKTYYSKVAFLEVNSQE